MYEGGRRKYFEVGRRNYEVGSVSPIGEEDGWKEEVLHTS